MFCRYVKYNFSIYEVFAALPLFPNILGAIAGNTELKLAQFLPSNSFPTSVSVKCVKLEMVFLTCLMILLAPMDLMETELVDRAMCIKTAPCYPQT